MRKKTTRKQPRPASLDTSVFNAVIAHGDADARLALARQLASLVADPRANPREKAEATPSLLRLLMDPEKKIRAAAARVLTPASGLSPDIVFTIAADDDDIALPFIERSPSVHGKRQLAIFKAGDISRRITMARRPDITRETIHAMAMQGERPVVAALLANSAAHVDNDDAKRIYVRFRDDEKIISRLLKFPHLPLEIRIAHVRHTTGNMRDKLKINGWLPDNEAAQAIAESEEQALADILARARDSEQLMAAISFAAHRKALTPAVIFRAACHGHVMVLEHAMAYLANMPVRRVRALAWGGSGMGFRTIYRKSGLPDGCLMLARAIFDVAAREGMKDFSRDKKLSPEAFGHKLLEKLATGYDNLSVAERTRLADLVARFAAAGVRPLARRLEASLSRAA